MINYLYMIADLQIIYRLLIISIFSFIFTFFFIRKYINFAKNNKLFQPIRVDGPKSHLDNKKNIPTMGGVFIILSIIISNLLFTKLSFTLYSILTIIIFFFIIGFIDDILKLTIKSSKGLKGSVKIILQFIFVSLIILINYYFNNIDNNLFGQNIAINIDIYLLLSIFMIIGYSNASNLTDGLDGLLSNITIIILLSLSFIIYILYGKIDHNPVYLEILLLLFSMIFSLLAFLIFNKYPAKIFMGDSASLVFGAVLSYIAIIISQELIFILMSLILIAEALSVIIQVVYFKIFRARFFLMAPLHHHFEKLGYNERYVNKIFTAITIITSLLAIIIFYIYYDIR